MTPDEIVSQLRSSAQAYYNTGEATMTDEHYDTLREQLEELNPDHPFLKEVGAPPKDKAVVLPFMMASLNKIKPGTGAVETFTKKALTPEQTWVLSEKLDGISALWYNGRLYLRGDGVNGVDVSSFATYIQGLVPTPYAVRGELVLPRGVMTGTVARSWVNGQLHQKVPIPEELTKIRFVAYERVNTTEPSWLQFNLLRKARFEIPWISLVSKTFMNDEALGKVLLERREKSIYDTDGIVVCENTALPSLSTQTTLKNPTYKVAFKMLLTDQCAETVIQEIEWNPSAQGFLIPRIRIEPVVVGTARIEYVTAHNARFVVDNKLGIGARIVIRRSGDVIPAVERVIQPSTQPLMPSQHTWKWQNNDATAAHIVLNGDAQPKEVRAARLVIFAKTLDIAGLGPGIAVKLVDAGLDTLEKVWKASGETLAKAIGKGNGAKITDQLSTLHPTESQLMVSSCLLPRGIGEVKLKTLFEFEPDVRKWKTLPVLAGWSADTLDELKSSLGPYEAWRRTELTQVPYPILSSPSIKTNTKPFKGSVCFTGVRSKELEARLESAGWKIVDAVSSTLTVLIVADGEANSMTGKAKKARDVGTVRILELSKATVALGLDSGV